MRILISNDDGVNAQGIKVLHQVLSSCFDVTVIAPDRNCSGASSSLTLVNPLRTTVGSNGFIAVNGSPTDSVHLGVTQLMQPAPEMVVSGINHGANLGDDTVYSGTVGAAIEGRHLGMPAIAVSSVAKQPAYFITAAQITKKIIEQLIKKPLPKDQILNINVPDIPLAEIKGIKVTRLGKRHKPEGMIKTQDPWGRDIYWYGALSPERDAEPDTDFYAVTHNYVSITPLTIDMTAYKNTDNLSQWLNELTL